MGMELLLTTSDQSALRRVLLARHDPVAVLSSDTAQALRRLVPCDVLQAGEADAEGYHLRGEDYVFSGPGYPPEMSPSQLPRVCEGPLNTGLEHFAAMDPEDPEVLEERAVGVRDVLRLGFPTGSGNVVQVCLARRAECFTPRDLAMLRLLEPVLGRVMRATPRTAPEPLLTPAEQRVLELVATGLTNRAAAEELFVAEATVRKHLENAYRKLGVSSRTAAVARLAVS
jgi:DNA-binding CsgD family transcriptional regulator